MPTQTPWFNSDMWKNHYKRTQKVGAAATAGATPPPGPELDLSAIGAGQKPVETTTLPTPPAMNLSGVGAQPASVAKPAPGQPPSPIPSPGTAPVSLTPAPSPVFNAAPYKTLENGVLQQLSAGINDKSALPGTEAAMRRNRETLAQYAGGVERQAGARAAKTGALGQGTAASLGDDTKTQVLSKLAENSQNETQLVSQEKQALIDKANQAIQFNQGLQENHENRLQNREQFNSTQLQNREQFNANLAQRKVEFEKTFGNQEASQYLNQLERMAVDNPVLAEKLSNHLMGGKTGPVGEFTPEEKAKLAEYVKKKEGSQGKLDEVMLKILEGLPAQVAAGQQSSTDAAAATEATKRLSLMKPGEKLSDLEFSNYVKNGAIKSYNAGGIPKGADGAAQILKDSPSGLISLQGQQFRVISGGGIGGKGDTQFIEMEDPATGTHYWHDANGKWYSERPAALTPSRPKNKEIPSPLKSA